MSQPARQLRPAPRAPIPSSPPAPQRRPRRLREACALDIAGDGDCDGNGAADMPEPSAGPGEVRRLQDQVAHAFTSPAGRSLETLLMQLIIVAATCLFLRTAIAGGGGFVAGLMH